MNAFRSVVGVGLLTLLSFGASASARAEGRETLNRAQKKAASSLLVCARDLVQASVREPVFPGVYAALELLQRAHMDIQSTLALKHEAQECRTLFNEYRSGELQKKDPEYALMRKKFGDWIQMGWWEAASQGPEGVWRLMARFHSAIAGDPYIICRLVGPKVAAGLGIVLTADVEAGLCTGVDQRRWLAVGAGLGLGLGGVAAIGLQNEEFRPLEGVAESKVQEELAIYFGVGGGVAYPEGRGNPDDITLGVGFGAYVGKSVHGAIRLIPVRSDSDEMLRVFLE